MTKIAVLDDNTRDATVIGFAANAKEAALIYSAYMADRMDADDFAELTIPDFAFRNPTDLAPELHAECSEGAFEPLV